MEARVRELRFTPAVIDGQAFGGTTHVVLGVCATQRDGNLALAADYRSNGPGFANGVPHHKPPPYPLEAIRAGHSAKMEVGFVVEPDGSATLESVEYDGFVHSSAKRFFEPALRHWVEQFRYLPEEVDGQPVRTLTAQVGTNIATRVTRAATRRRVDGKLTARPGLGAAGPAHRARRLPASAASTVAAPRPRAARVPVPRRGATRPG